MRFRGLVTQGGGRQTALPWAIVSLPLRGARPNKSLQATAAAPFLLDGLGGWVPAGSIVAQSPAAVPDLYRSASWDPCLRCDSSYSQTVSTIKDIETVVKQLSRDELSAFRTWFFEFDAEAWDRQFEQDVQASRLDRLADEALSELHQGRCTDL